MAFRSKVDGVYVRWCFACHLCPHCLSPELELDHVVMATLTINQILYPCLNLSSRGDHFRRRIGGLSAGVHRLSSVSSVGSRQNLSFTPRLHTKQKDHLDCRPATPDRFERHTLSLDGHRYNQPKASSASVGSTQSTQQTFEDDVDDWEADVVVVGAGVIGLFIADALLSSANPELADVRVALIDSAEPCAGATGAGETADNRDTAFTLRG